MKISIHITDNQFSTSAKEEMWDLYKDFYHYSKAYFMERIEKNNHFAIYTAAGKMVGFTGLRINRTKINGKRSLLINFGQTVIKKEFRGNALLPFTGLKLCFKFYKDVLFSNIYFWCDALTYKSYLVLVKSMSECYPSHKQETPETAATLINYIGQTYYADSFCAETGTVYKATNLVNDLSTQIKEQDELDDDIRFFMKANPNHAKGHGLLTLSPLTRKAFFSVLTRFANTGIKNLEQYRTNLAQQLQSYLSGFYGTASSSI